MLASDETISVSIEVSLTWRLRSKLNFKWMNFNTRVGNRPHIQFIDVNWCRISTHRSRHKLHLYVNIARQKLFQVEEGAIIAFYQSIVFYRPFKMIFFVQVVYLKVNKLWYFRWWVVIFINYWSTWIIEFL